MVVVLEHFVALILAFGFIIIHLVIQLGHNIIICMYFFCEGKNEGKANLICLFVNIVASDVPTI